MAAATTTVSFPRRTPSAHRPESGGRNFVFDLLRVVGLFSIVLAHVDPPDVVWALRSFDVPLMVLVSGAVFQIGFSGRAIALGAYFRKRAFRLLAPVYAFLIFYFAVSAILTPGRFHGRMIWRTFLLLDGIGYVWIIRVFLIVALIAPFLLAWRRRLSPATFLALLGGIYLAHELLFAWFDTLPSFGGEDLVEFTVFYLLPYSVVFGLGLRWPGMSRRQAFAIGAIALAICGGLFASFADVPVFTLIHDHKYPPHLVYFWYGLGASHLLYALALSTRNFPGKMSAAIEWLSASSLWIYLWHIPGLTIAEKTLGRFHPGDTRFAAAWLITVAFAVFVTCMQKISVQWLIERMRPRRAIADTLSIVFLK
jgi:peptidoglycan/LPS O-acetylase OafA/YrhL